MTARDPLAVRPAGWPPPPEVECPTCGVEADQECVENEWYGDYYAALIIVEPHRSRVRAAEREKEENRG